MLPERTGHTTGPLRDPVGSPLEATMFCITFRCYSFRLIALALSTLEKVGDVVMISPLQASATFTAYLRVSAVRRGSDLLARTCSTRVIRTCCTELSCRASTSMAGTLGSRSRAMRTSCGS